MSESNSNHATCMAHGCTKTTDGGARGLCLTHYKMLLREVQKGTYTWEYLESIGACKKSEVQRNPEDKKILAQWLVQLGAQSSEQSESED